MSSKRRSAANENKAVYILAAKICELIFEEEAHVAFPAIGLALAGEMKACGKVDVDHVFAMLRPLIIETLEKSTIEMADMHAVGSA